MAQSPTIPYPSPGRKGPSPSSSLLRGRRLLAARPPCSMLGVPLKRLSDSEVIALALLQQL